MGHHRPPLAARVARTADRVVTARITSRPGRMGGVPCIDGTRIPAETIARLYNDGEITPELVAHYCPSVTVDDVLAAHEWWKEQSCT